MPGKEIGHFRLCPFSQALLPGCASHTNLALSGRELQDTHALLPSPLAPGPTAPGCSPVRQVLWGGLRYLKKKSCFDQALIPLVVAISGEPSGGCLGHLPLGNGPAYLARDWPSPYLLTLACLTPGLGSPLRAVLESCLPQESSMAKKRAWTSPLTPYT